ncbi:MAG TPA: DUF192 domain-containing protein [bacterium]|nr:DUF192 domain-containing protein [bacterium]
MRIRIPLALAAAAAMLLSCTTSASSAKTIPVRFGKNTLSVEIARNEQERQHGLMFRRELGRDAGMIFVFDAPEDANFWMKNTPLPLSIAFLDSEKVVLNIDEMAPFDEKSFHRSKGKALYAVEANANWFESHGVKAGDKAEFDLP